MRSSSITGASIFLSPNKKERQTNFKVVVRVRPPLPREISGNDSTFKNVVAVHSNEQIITVSEHLDGVIDEHGELFSSGAASNNTFVFDHVYDQNSTQKKVYEMTARGVVDSALQGYNATIFAYGQTGTGKTYTMEGFNTSNGSIEDRGIIPRAIEQIFSYIQAHVSTRMRFLVRASYLQIYNEQISDLLKPERINLSIREDKKKGVYVEGLSEWVVRSPAEIYGLMERGGTLRATGETKMNEASSRSHAVFIVIAEQVETVYVDDQGVEMSANEFNRFMHDRGVRREEDMKLLEDHVRQSFKVGKLNLVDLAGSERVRLSGATGQRLEESKQINRSLSALGNVISALTESKGRAHIPYRDSKLTRMLEDSLGGNCKTTMMAMLSPALEAIAETISTLKFANRAKNIRNEAKVNEDLDQKSLLRKYERELKKLRAELEARSKNVVDKRRLLELDEQRRRAEADKMAAIRALEMRSKEFMQEKEEKKKLEHRIAQLMGQMIRGEGKTSQQILNGIDASADPNLHILLKDQQDRLRQEYEGKLADLERERESVVEEKAQVDRYKQLLLKQRDIMIALTQRLVERDEQIVSLQDELDAYDKHHKELEEKLDEKTALLIKFQRISMEVNARSPYKNEELSKAMDAWADWNSLQGINSGTEESSFSVEETINNAPDGANSNNSEEIKLIIEKVIQSEWAICLRNIQESNTNIVGSTTYISSMVHEISKKLQKSITSVVEKLNKKIKVDAVEKDEANPRTTNSSLIQDQCDLLIKERNAVYTIMEQKIKVLVQSIAQAVSVVLQSSGNIGNTAHALAKDVAALERLVNASIAALRNAVSIGPDSSLKSHKATEQIIDTFSDTIFYRPPAFSPLLTETTQYPITSKPSRSAPAPPSSFSTTELKTSKLDQFQFKKSNTDSSINFDLIRSKYS